MLARNFLHALLVAALPCVVSGCETLGDARPSPQVVSDTTLVSFEARSFTRPQLSVEPTGRLLYFDVLGEIYRVPTIGGWAQRMDLGPGWKTSPVVSPGGDMLAFLSDRGGTVGLWIKRLDTSDAPFTAWQHAHHNIYSWAWQERDTVAFNQAQPPHQSISGIGAARISGAAIQALPPRQARDHLPATIIGPGILPGALVVARPLGPNLLLQLDPSTGHETPLYPGLIRRLEQLSVSPNRQWVGFAAEEGEVTTLRLLSLHGGQVVETGCVLDSSLWSGSGTDLPPPTYAFLPDSTGIISNRNGHFEVCRIGKVPEALDVTVDVQMQLASRARPNETATLAAPPLIRYPAIDPAGNEVAFSNGGALWRMQLANGSARAVATGPGRAVMPAYSPDGSRLVYTRASNGTSYLEVIELATGRIRTLRESTEVLYANPAWSPDGYKLAFVEAPRNAVRDDKPVGIVWIAMDSGLRSELASVVPTTYNNRSYPALSWSADGKALLYLSEISSSNRVLIRQELQGEPIGLVELDSMLWDAAISPDAKWIAVLHRDGISVAPMMFSINETPKLTRAEVESWMRVASHNVDYMRWSRDGRLLWSLQDQIVMSSPVGEEVLQRKFALPPRAVASSKEAKRLAYVGARIITMEGDEVIENGVLVVRGNEIEHVGSVLPSHMVGAVQTIDVSGKTIIPGLVDVHRHIRASDLDVSDGTSHALFANAAYGVTTVYDPAFYTIEAAELTEISRDDRFPGATYYGSGHGILGDFLHTAYARVETIEDARRHVSRMALFGSPMVKSYLRQSRNERKNIVAAARELGVGVAVHEAAEMSVQLGAVQDGVTSLEHPILMNATAFHDDVVRFLRKSEVVLTPTLADSNKATLGKFLFELLPVEPRATCIYAGEGNRSMIKNWSRTEVAPWTRWGQVPDSARSMAKIYADLLKAGVRLTVGAHDLPDGIGTHRELWALVFGGATPMQALRAATHHGAYKLGLENKIGKISPGMDADIVVLNSNPLEDIRNTVDINFVVRRGNVLSWPNATRWPVGWNVEASWDSCRAWNLGLPAPGLRAH